MGRRERRGRISKVVRVTYEVADKIHKNILVFARSKKTGLYDVLVAEGIMSNRYEWARVGVVGSTAAVVSGALCVINPAAGLTTLAFSVAGMTYGTVYGKKQDVVMGYMLRQLVDGNTLSVTEAGRITFKHGEGE